MLTNPVEILVYGSLNMDFVAFLDNLPEKGETISAKEFSMIPGGKAANQAVAASRLGIKSAMVGRIGDDYLGQQLKNGLNLEGIITEHIKPTIHSSTGVAMVSVDQQGNNVIVTDRGANALLSKQDVDDSAELLKYSKAAVLQLEMEQTVAEYIIRKAREYNQFIVLNLAPVVPIDPKTLTLVDLLIVNENESSQLTGVKVDSVETAILAAGKLSNLGIENVIITLGANGAVLLTPTMTKHVIAPRVNVVDSTAAGDCFVAAVTSFWIKDGDLVMAVEKAVQIAAMSVMKKGAQSSLPTLREFYDFVGEEVS